MPSYCDTLTLRRKPSPFPPSRRRLGRPSERPRRHRRQHAWARAAQVLEEKVVRLHAPEAADGCKACLGVRAGVAAAVLGHAVGVGRVQVVQLRVQLVERELPPHEGQPFADFAARIGGVAISSTGGAGGASRGPERLSTFPIVNEGKGVWSGLLDSQLVP